MNNELSRWSRPAFVLAALAASALLSAPCQTCTGQANAPQKSTTLPAPPELRRDPRPLILGSHKIRCWLEIDGRYALVRLSTSREEEVLNPFLQPPLPANSGLYIYDAAGAYVGRWPPKPRNGPRSQQTSAFTGHRIKQGLVFGRRVRFVPKEKAEIRLNSVGLPPGAYSIQARFKGRHLLSDWDILIALMKKSVKRQGGPIPRELVSDVAEIEIGRGVVSHIDEVEHPVSFNIIRKLRPPPKLWTSRYSPIGKHIEVKLRASLAKWTAARNTSNVISAGATFINTGPSETDIYFPDLTSPTPVRPAPFAIGVFTTTGEYLTDLWIFRSKRHVHRTCRESDWLTLPPHALVGMSTVCRLHGVLDRDDNELVLQALIYDSLLHCRRPPPDDAEAFCERLSKEFPKKIIGRSFPVTVSVP